MDKTECKVTFIYDETEKGWDVFVSGVENEIEAVQAFSAVLLTMQHATPGINYNRATPTETKGVYEISVGQ